MKILGFNVRFTTGSLFLIILITFFISLNLRTLFPEYNIALIGVISLLSGLIFIASILVHELCHSVMARKYGIGVASIEMQLFGGVSYLTDPPKSPKEDFNISVIGPLSSFGLAVLFAAVGTVVSLLGGPLIVLVIMSYLTIINLLLAVFNLLPAAPLDGGRVLRSIVWKITGSFKKGALFAANSGLVHAILLGAIGAFLIFTPYSIAAGVWLIFIAYTMWRGAALERYAIREGLLDGDESK